MGTDSSRDKHSHTFWRNKWFLEWFLPKLIGSCWKKNRMFSCGVYYTHSKWTACFLFTEGENTSLLERKTHFAPFSKVAMVAFPPWKWHFCHSDLPARLASAATSSSFMYYIPEPPLPVSPHGFGTGSQLMLPSMLHPNADTPMEEKCSCCNTFLVENRVKWAHRSISSCYSRTGSRNQASLDVFTLGWMVEIYLATVVFWNDTLWCKDSLII